MKNAGVAQRKAALEVWQESLDARRDGAGEGRWAIHRSDPDAPFSLPELSDRALTAAVWTTARFDKSFTGWQLYRRIMVGFDGFDEELLEWAVGCAWALARAKTRSGRDYLRAGARGPWIDWAAADAMYCAIYGRYPVRSLGGVIRGERFATYRKIRDPVAAGILAGLESFRSELHYQYHRAGKAYLDENARSISSGNKKVWRLRIAIDPDSAGEFTDQYTDGAGNFWNRAKATH